MHRNGTPRPMTAKKIIYDQMVKVFKSNQMMDITGLKDTFDDEIPASTIRQAVYLNTVRHFDDVRFFVRTRRDGRLFLGAKKGEEPKSRS